MDSQKIDMYLATNSAKLPSEKLMLIKDQLEKLPDDRFIVLSSVSLKDPTVAILLSILVSGVDRFYVGDIGLGIAKILTCGGLGIWSIVDWFLIMNRAKEANFQSIIKIIN